MTSYDPPDDGLTAAERAARRSRKLVAAWLERKRQIEAARSEAQHWNPTEEEDMSDNKDRYLRVNEDGVITVGGEVFYDISGQLSSGYIRTADLATYGAGTISGDITAAEAEQIKRLSDEDQEPTDALRSAVRRISAVNPPSSESLARAWWEGANAQWKHRPIGNRIPDTKNPYRKEAPDAR